MKAAIGAWLESSDFGLGEYELQCPICGPEGGCGQHHSHVELFERDREDGPSRVYNSLDEVWLPSVHNPSARRHAIRVHMECECCHESTNEPHRWWFDIIQHKGATYLQVGIRE